MLLYLNLKHFDFLDKSFNLKHLNILSLCLIWRINHFTWRYLRLIQFLWLTFGWGHLMTFIIQNEIFIVFKFITQLKIFLFQFSLWSRKRTYFLLKFSNFDIFLIKLRMEMEFFFLILLNVLIEPLIESFDLVELKLKIFEFFILFFEEFDLLVFEFDDILKMSGRNLILGEICGFEFEWVVLDGFDFEWSLKLRYLFVLVFEGKIFLSE